MKKIGLLMNLLMGFTMSLVLSLVGTLHGGHFTVAGWLFSFGVSLVISLLIGFLVPVKKIGDSLCEKIKVNPMSPKGNFVGAFVSDLIYTPVITVAMVVLMLKLAEKALAAQGISNAVPPVAKVLPGSLLMCFVVGYIAIAVAQPVFLKLLFKKFKPEEKNESYDS